MDYGEATNSLSFFFFLNFMKYKVFIGADSREEIAYDVAKHSILKRTQGEVSIHPLWLTQMRDLGIYERPVDALGTTEFTFSRFWVPYLMGYEGIGIFIDCDFVVNCDIMEMFRLAEERFTDPEVAVAVCKHDYIPRDGPKMDGKAQASYPRKNWSSSMVFNCSHPLNQRLSLSVLNDASRGGKYFHRFQWLGDSPDDEANMAESEPRLGSLPIDFNWLSGEYSPPDHISPGLEVPRIVHYTLGGPWFADERCWEYPYTDWWLAECAEVLGRPWTREDCVDR